MAKFPVPASPVRHVVNIEHFKGVDLYNAAANVAVNRSPDAPNMIRDEVGKVRKRMGYEVVDRLGSFPVNGVHFLRRPGTSVRLVHAGRGLYRWEPQADDWMLISDQLQDERSRSVQIDGTLYLADGTTFWACDGTTLKDVCESAYVPTCYVGRTPDGGGVPHEPRNLLTGRWSEQFCGTEGAVRYRLSERNLSAAKVTAQLLGSGGVWVDVSEGTAFTVNRAAGEVTFHTPPGTSSVEGADNVRITVEKTRSGDRERIARCTVMALYGMGGAPERLFLGGNRDHPNMDWYSAPGNPTYFPATSGTVVGRDSGAIMGYSIVGDRLATHLAGGQNDENIILRSGKKDENGREIFPIVNTLCGAETVSKDAFAALGREPLFLTERGVYGLAHEELNGERYGQLRSFYLGEQLSLPGTKDACAVAWRDFYVLAAKGRLYILDGLQKDYQANAPHATFQYECYYWTDIAARVLWVEDDALWFGTSDGKICRFHTNVDDPRSYNDDGRAIKAYWDTPDLDGHLFFKNKTFRYVAVRLAAAVVTGIEIFAQVRGLWGKIFDGGERARYLDWSYIDFSKFVFSSDRTPRTLGGKVKLKKVDKARFRLQNEKHNEPFGLYAFAAEYTEPGNNFKG